MRLARVGGVEHPRRRNDAAPRNCPSIDASVPALAGSRSRSADQRRYPGPKVRIRLPPANIASVGVGEQIARDQCIDLGDAAVEVRNLSSSAGPIRKNRARGSARCCSPTTTIPTGGWSMPAAPAPASTGGTGAAMAKTAAVGYRQNAARRAAAARQPLRIAFGSQPCALGAARAGGRGQVSNLDRGQTVAPGRV